MITTHKELVNYLTEDGEYLECCWTNMIFRKRIRYTNPELDEYTYCIKEVMLMPNQ